MHINELRGGRRKGEAADRYTQRQRRGNRKKYVEMTKADAKQEASGKDEALKTARLPSGARERERESSLPFPRRSVITLMLIRLTSTNGLINN